MDALRYYAKGLLKQLYEKEIFLWAQAIAFKVIITLVPIIILGTGLLGRLLQGERPFRYVAGLIRDFMPAYGSDRLIEFLGQLQGASTTLTIIGVTGLLLTATTLFTTLRLVLASIFKEDWHSARSILHGYAFDLRMAIQVGAFFMASIGLTVLLQAVGPRGIAVLTDIGLDPGRTRSAWQFIVQSLTFVLPFMLSIGMFLQLFYFIPMPRPPKRSALAGALASAVLWETAKWGFTAYATRFGGFDAGFAALLGDSFILILLLLFWAYYSGLVMCIGAIVTLLYEARHREAAAEADLETTGNTLDEPPDTSATASEVDTDAPPPAADVTDPDPAAPDPVTEVPGGFHPREDHAST